MRVYAPANFAELKAMLEEAVLRWDGPAAVRYPRGGEGEYREDSGRAPAAVLRRGSHITLVSYGVEINDVLQAARLLEERGVEAEVVKLNIITPLDAAPVLDSVRRTGALLVAEDSVSAGSGSPARWSRPASAPGWRCAAPAIPLPPTAAWEN